MSIRPDNEQTRAHAARIIASGGLIAFRTDTFYGLGADPLHVKAVERIKTLKGRDEGKPILLLIGDLVDVDALVSSRPPSFAPIAEHFWPGPLTIVLPASEALPEAITCGTHSVGLRLPDNGQLRSFVTACGGRLTATSANPSDSSPATSAVEVARYFPIGIDLIIDGGMVTTTQPSTVIDVTCEPTRVIREGAVSRAALEDFLGRPIE